jgi:SAM-dependent methyltransferase
METLETVNKEAEERLYPSLTNPNWLVLRKRRMIFEKWVAQLGTRQLDVLDIGGRLQPYRPLLSGKVRRYVVIDLRRTPLVNIIARGEQLPVTSERFDLIICTQMLEYVPEPADVIAEMHRVLKPDGYLFLSAPAASPRDSASDCWRFLPAGLRHLLIPFNELEIVPEGGSIAGLLRTINVCLSIFVRYPAMRAVYCRTFCPLINLLGAGLERLAGSQNDQFAVNYSVRARKKIRER